MMKMEMLHEVLVVIRHKNIFMKKNIITVFLLLVSSAYAGRYNCYEYPSSAYALVHKPNALNPNAKDVTERVDTSNYKLLLVASKKETKGHERHLFLLDKKGKKIENSYHSCPSKKLHPDRLYCYGECDSGIFSIEPDKSINFKTKDITLGDEDLWNVEPKNSADLPKPIKVTCPQSVESMDMIPKSDTKAYKEGIRTAYEHLEKPARYVCYTSKKMIGDTMHYRGCRYTRESCDNYYGNMKHFGKYATQKEALRAFERCKTSTPKASINLPK